MKEWLDQRGVASTKAISKAPLDERKDEAGTAAGEYRGLSVNNVTKRVANKRFMFFAEGIRSRILKLIRQVQSQALAKEICHAKIEDANLELNPTGGTGWTVLGKAKREYYDFQA